MNRFRFTTKHFLMTCIGLVAGISLCGCSSIADGFMQALEQQMVMEQANQNETQIVEEAPDYVNQGEIVAFSEDGDPVYSYENGEFLNGDISDGDISDGDFFDGDVSEADVSEGEFLNEEAGEMPGNISGNISEEIAGDTSEDFTDGDISEENASGEIQEEFTDAAVDRTNPNYVEYRFRSKKLLNQHYEKHGIEMGFDSKEEYQAAASDVINNPKALTKTEKEDGDYVYYVEETNEFVILSLDGYIRTYFNPNGGRKYFDRQ